MYNIKRICPSTCIIVLFCNKTKHFEVRIHSLVGETEKCLLAIVHWNIQFIKHYWYTAHVWCYSYSMCNENQLKFSEQSHVSVKLTLFSSYKWVLYVGCEEWIALRYITCNYFCYACSFYMVSWKLIYIYGEKPREKRYHHCGITKRLIEKIFHDEWWLHPYNGKVCTSFLLKPLRMLHI